MTLSLKVNVFFTRKHESGKIRILSQLFILPGRPRRGAAVLSNPARKKAMCCGKVFLSWLTVLLFWSNSFFSTENTLTLQPAEKITFSCRAASRWWLFFGLQNYHARSWLLYLWNPPDALSRIAFCLPEALLPALLSRQCSPVMKMCRMHSLGYAVGPTAFTQTDWWRKGGTSLHSAEDRTPHIGECSYDVAFLRACWTRIRCAQCPHWMIIMVEHWTSTWLPD